MPEALLLPELGVGAAVEPALDPVVGVALDPAVPVLVGVVPIPGATVPAPVLPEVAPGVTELAGPGAVGSKSSAEVRALPLASKPPATRTLPLGSMVTV